MTELTDKLAAARAEVARLERIAATATCREVGCDMQHVGGRNCGCEGGVCSVPVYVCTRCGDSDYGVNAEAAERRAECADYVTEARAGMGVL
jgi:hypothetical protein